MPKISSFSLVPMSSNLAPRKNIGHRKNKESVFVFTPINFGGQDDNKSKVNFQWVANDVAEVCLTLFNPLPTEVKIVNLALLHEGIEFETLPSTLSLSPNSGPHTVSLLGVPKDAGELKILGYTFNVLGVQSTCRLRGAKGQATDYTITVLPSLPQIDASLKRVLSVDAQECDENSDCEGGANAEEQGDKKYPKETRFSKSNADEVLRLYHGESANYELFFTNISNIKEENVKISCSAHPGDMNDMVRLEGPGVGGGNEQGLSLDPGESSSVKVYVEATRLLLNNTVITQDDSDLASIGMMSRQDPTRWSNMSRETESASASNSAKRPTVVTLDFKVSYSGGEGGKQGYHRELIKPLKVDICPSALVTKWDVLPAEIVNENYLVLDISNQTIHEMDIEYGPTNKTLSIEPNDLCRIPVPISKFTKNNDSVDDEAANQPPYLVRRSSSEDSRRKACSDHLRKSVKIKWRLPRLNGRHGIVSMRSIKLRDEMISSLELCPLQWRVRVNEVDLDNENSLKESGHQPHNVLLGQEVSLVMKAKSDFDFDLTGHFSVEVTEVGSNDSASTGSEVLVVQSQPESGILDCSPGSTMEHTTSILPLSTGTYDVICTCSIVKQVKSSKKQQSELQTPLTTISTPDSNSVFSFVSKYPKITINVSDFYDSTEKH